MLLKEAIGNERNLLQIFWRTNILRCYPMFQAVIPVGRILSKMTAKRMLDSRQLKPLGLVEWNPKDVQRLDKRLFHRCPAGAGRDITGYTFVKFADIFFESDLRHRPLLDKD
jgi:hypothetical protein